MHTQWLPGIYAHSSIDLHNVDAMNESVLLCVKFTL